MTDTDIINSDSYWNGRFAENWEACEGPRQSRFFGRIAIEHLPRWLVEQLKRQSLTLADWGCAQGDGTDVWAGYIDAKQIVGVDFSSVAIEQAAQRYPAIRFINEDWLTESCDQVEVFDVVFSSNTLEHFHTPYDALQTICNRAKKAIVLTLPYKELERIDEHLFSFLPENIPTVLRNGFRLVWSQVVDCRSLPNTLWDGDQIVLAYADPNWVDSLGLTLGDCRIEQSDTATDVGRLNAIIAERDERIDSLNQNLAERDERIDSLNQLLSEKNKEIELLKTSTSWVITRPIRFAKKFMNNPRRAVYDALKFVYWRLPPGIREQLHKPRNLVVRQARKGTFGKDPTVIAAMSQAMANNKNNPVIVFRPLIDWYVPLFQRPQHLAQQLARLDFNYFYCTPRVFNEKNISLLKIEKNLYLTNQYASAMEMPNLVLHVYAGDMAFEIDEIKYFQSKGCLIVYEYIDEIHHDLSGIEIPKKVWERHEYVLKSEEIVVICSAEKLLRQVHAYRRKNVLHVTNGVEIDHFSCVQRVAPPSQISDFINTEAPVIGYFGALAKWFDYELIVRLATERPEYNILLIGWDYDQSLSKYSLNRFKNIRVVGPIDYKELPKFAAWFDVSIIPFVINEITESTSPIKLFEYMALGKPIVTTDMPECKRYKSALVAKDHSDFILKVDHALSLGDDADYAETLRNEAKENSWYSKGENISKLIHSNLCSYKNSMLDDVQTEIALLMMREPSGPDGYFQKYHQETYMPEERFYWFPVLDWIDNLGAVGSVADIGAAYGTLLLYAIKKHNPKSMITVDPCDYMANSLVEKYGIERHKADFEREMILQGRQFDLILFTEVLEHLNFHPSTTLSRLASLLTDEGHIVITTPDAEEWGRVTDYYQNLGSIPRFEGQTNPWIDGHVWQYTRDEAEAVFSEAGFEIVDWAYSKGVAARHLCYLLKKCT